VVYTGAQCPRRQAGRVSSIYEQPGAYLSYTDSAGSGLLHQSDALVLGNQYGSTVPATFDCQALPKCEVSP
jgi:hypothetical protein